LGGEIKILHLQLIQIKSFNFQILLKKSRPERNLIVKKLTEEDEYKPFVKKSPLEDKDLMQLVKTSTNFASKSINSINNNASDEATRPRVSSSTRPSYRGNPVEIIGVGTTNGFQSGSANSNNNNDNDPQTAPRSANNSRTDFSLESTLAHNLNHNSINNKLKTVKLGDNLTEKNYLQIIDNLTSRYGGGGSSSDITSSTKFNGDQQQQQQQQQQRKYKKVKNNDEEDTENNYYIVNSNNLSNISLDLINNLGLNLDMSWSSSRLAAAANVSAKPVNLKEMERKYRERYMRETSANNIKKELIIKNLNAQFQPSMFHTLLLHTSSNTSLAHSNNNHNNKNLFSPRAYSTRTYSTESKSRPSSPTHNSNDNRAQSNISNSSSKMNTPVRMVVREKSFSKMVITSGTNATNNKSSPVSTTYLQLAQPISPALRRNSQGTTKKT